MISAEFSLHGGSHSPSSFMSYVLLRQFHSTTGPRLKRIPRILLRTPYNITYPLAYLRGRADDDMRQHHRTSRDERRSHLLWQRQA
jgi:hypothetical protein